MIAAPEAKPVTAMTTEPMTIGDDSVVSFHYKLRDDTGTFNESSEEGSPVVYMHGHNNIVPGLEKELTGKKSGDKLTATVRPEEGYGQRNENAVQRVPVKHLATRGPFNVGQMYALFAEAIRTGQSQVPTFDTAVELHRFLDTLKQSSDTGRALPVA